MAKTSSTRYVVYQETLHILCGISFSKDLTDYIFHLLAVEEFVAMPEGAKPHIEDLVKAPMDHCRELEGHELEAVRILYEPA